MYDPMHVLEKGKPKEKLSISDVSRKGNDSDIGEKSWRGLWKIISIILSIKINECLLSHVLHELSHIT